MTKTEAGRMIQEALHPSQNFDSDRRVPRPICLPSTFTARCSQVPKLSDNVPMNPRWAYRLADFRIPLF